MIEKFLIASLLIISPTLFAENVDSKSIDSNFTVQLNALEKKLNTQDELLKEINSSFSPVVKSVTPVAFVIDNWWIFVLVLGAAFWYVWKNFFGGLQKRGEEKVDTFISELNSRIASNIEFFKDLEKKNQELARLIKKFEEDISKYPDRYQTLLTEFTNRINSIEKTHSLSITNFDKEMKNNISAFEDERQKIMEQYFKYIDEEFTRRMPGSNEKPSRQQNVEI